MRNQKLLLFLTGIVAVLLAVFVLLKTSGRVSDRTAGAAVPITDAKADEVDYAVFRWADQSECFVKSNGVWHLERDDSFPVSSAKLSTAIRKLLGTTSDWSADGTMQDYGFETGTPKILLRTKDGTEHSFVFGMHNTTADRDYLLVDSETAYLVDSSLISALPDSAEALLDLQPAPIHFSEPETVTYHSGGQTVTLRYSEEPGLSYSPEYVWFLPDADNLPVDTATVNQIAALALSLQWDRAFCYAPDPAQLQACGLSAPAAELEITDCSRETFSVRIGAKCDDTCYYAASSRDSGIYLLDNAAAESILAIGSYDFRPDEILLPDLTQLNGLDLSAGGKSISIQISKNNDRILYTADQGRPDAQTLNSLLSLLSTVQAAAFTEDSPETFGRQLFSITFHPSDRDSDPMVISASEFSEDFCRIQFAGYSHMLVSRTAADSIMDLINRLFSYFDRGSET